MKMVIGFTKSRPIFVFTTLQAIQCDDPSRRRSPAHMGRNCMDCMGVGPIVTDSVLTDSRYSEMFGRGLTSSEQSYVGRRHLDH